MDIDMELLISLVENRPVLWDNTQECYKERRSTIAAWNKISIALNDDFETLSDKEKHDFSKNIIKKWNNARDNWIKCHKKILEFGSDTIKQRKYKFYDQMQFLTTIFTRRKTDSYTSEVNISQSQSDCEQTDFQTNHELSESVDTITKPRKNKKRKTDCNEERLLTVENEESKSMSFFKSIAPIVDKYSDEDYIEFQYKVIKIMRDLIRRNHN